MILESASRFESMDYVQSSILASLLERGETISPRGDETLELRSASFTLDSPRKRCLASPQRRWSLPLAIGELCWHLSGETSVEGLAYYAPAWRRFAGEDGNVRGSCYGRKGFAPGEAASPWTMALNLLKSDPSSRRCVLYFSDPVSHLEPDCRDAACATSLQFMIRKNRLEAFVSMRSNDAIWGLPYDVFLFTFMQEMMAVSLGLDLGPYHHHAASLHLYKRHFQLAERIARAPISQASAMPQIQNYSELRQFLALERHIRETGDTSGMSALSPYWRDLAQVLVLFRLSQAQGWPAAMAASPASFAYRQPLEPLSRTPA